MTHQTVRVYADRRLCIPNGVLDEFRALSKAKGKSVWVSAVGSNGSTSILLTWKELNNAMVLSSRRYDMSIRNRVLFHAPEGVEPFKPAQMYPLVVSANSIQIALEPTDSAPTPPRSSKVRGVTVPVGKSSLQTTTPQKRDTSYEALKSQFDASVNAHVLHLIRTQFSYKTLAQIGPEFPDLTVGELMYGRRTV